MTSRAIDIRAGYGDRQQAYGGEHAVETAADVGRNDEGLIALGIGKPFAAGLRGPCPGLW
jgi:hypothetical protein